MLTDKHDSMNPIILKEQSLIKPWIQDIYWGNFKGLATPNNLKHWRGYFGDFFNRPYIIFTGTNRLPLERLKLNDEAIDNINSKCLRIFCFEPFHFKLLDEPHNRGWFSEFRSDVDYSKIRADELDSVLEFTQKYNLKKVGIHSPNYRIREILGASYPSLLLEDNFVFCSMVRQHTDVISDIPEKQIKKSFICLNNRYAFHRHLTMAYLVKFSGNYSWQFEVDQDFLKHINWLEPNKLNSKLLAQLEEGNRILNANHLYTDHKFEKIKISDNFNHYYKTTPLLSLSAGYFKGIQSLYRESFVSIVPESRYAQPLAFTSEKTNNAISQETPFIIVGGPYSLQFLKEKFGIKTFSNYWDESYDLEEDHTKRMNKIFQTIEYIGNLSVNEQQKMYNSMREQLKENKRKLREFSQIDYIDQFRLDPLLA